MDIITADFETFWSDTHSLTKMNPIEYVMHPDTEIQSLSVKLNDGETIVIFGEERIQKFCDSVDWSDVFLVAHNNSEFDAMIFAWRFGVKPKMWGCTLAMARPHYKSTVGGSLKALASALGVGEKGSLESVNTKGKRLAEFTKEEREKMRVYNKDDTDLCYGILTHLLPLTPKVELRIIDSTIRMLVEGQYELDVDILRDALEKEKERKRLAILDVAKQINTAADFTSEDEAIAFIEPILMSQQQFAGLLTRLGADVPVKTSKTNGKSIPALAKTDSGMLELLEHPDPRVATAAAGRLGVKSSQLETRIETFLKVGEWCSGVMPMPYRYCGADATWRLSGIMSMNVQNMPRRDRKRPKPSEVLRMAFKAPKGKVVVVVDSSNIELRVVHTLSNQHDTVEMLRNRQDLYCDFGSVLFGRTITKADEAERFIGKTAHLGLQYGAGAAAFQRMVKILSTANGFPMDIESTESKRVVDLWRSTHGKISDKSDGIWGRCERAIAAMANGNTVAIDDHGLCFTGRERIFTPGGRFLYYPNLRRERDDDGKVGWVYTDGRRTRRLYGSMLLENISQHLARNIVMEQSLELGKYAQIVSSTHDESAIIVPESQAEEAVKVSIEIFSTAPKWWPDIPLAAEAGWGYTYGSAK